MKVGGKCTPTEQECVTTGFVYSYLSTIAEKIRIVSNSIDLPNAVAEYLKSMIRMKQVHIYRYTERSSCAVLSLLSLDRRRRFRFDGSVQAASPTLAFISSTT